MTALSSAASSSHRLRPHLTHALAGMGTEDRKERHHEHFGSHRRATFAQHTRRG